MPTDRTFGAVDITTTPLGDATVQPAQPTPTEVAGQQETALPEMTPGPGIGEQVDEPLGFQPEARPAVDAQSEQPQGEGGVEVVTVTA